MAVHFVHSFVVVVVLTLQSSAYAVHKKNEGGDGLAYVTTRGRSVIWAASRTNVIEPTNQWRFLQNPNWPIDLTPVLHFVAFYERQFLRRKPAKRPFSLTFVRLLATCTTRTPLDFGQQHDQSHEKLTRSSFTKKIIVID
eukprot:scaffold22578_cov164-Cylindrotheca_fusiformis.AAC.1